MKIRELILELEKFEYQIKQMQKQEFPRIGDDPDVIVEISNGETYYDLSIELGDNNILIKVD